ncbi:MAG: hypothetical protein JSS79_00120 [Bacteroidetes bacterium]|nr:hypothetical protein [Bacteroidota bacterium]
MNHFIIRSRSARFVIAFSLALLSCGILLAQDDVNKKIAQETCDCISKQNLANKSKGEIEGELGICMLDAINKNKVEIDISDQAAMTEFGKKVGMLMAPICPSVFKVFMDTDDDEKGITVTGKIKSVEIEDFVYVIVHDEEGQDRRVIWLSNFSGSDSFVSDPKKLIGKNVSLKYRNVEYYVAKAKGYLSLKEIVELKIKE